MSMTPEEMRALAIEIECGAVWISSSFLSAYTAAVEARVHKELTRTTVATHAVEQEFQNQRRLGIAQGRREERESLTKKLAEQQLAYKVLHDAAKHGGVVFTFFDPQKELDVYTAAVEAQERERIALHFEGQRTDSCPGTVISKEIRSLK